MRFSPKLFLIKILCSIGILRVGCEERVGYVEMSAETKKTMVLINYIEDVR